MPAMQFCIGFSDAEETRWNEISGRDRYMTNKYRCETCQKRAGKLICNTFVNEADGDISGVLWSTSIIGCASHSDFQSERDNMLDDLIQNVSERIKELKEMRAKDVYDDCTILALVGENQAMWAQLKELRQAGEQK
jgi:hypothetical protein